MVNYRELYITRNMDMQCKQYVIHFPQPKSVDLALIWFMSYKHITVIRGLSRLDLHRIQH